MTVLSLHPSQTDAVEALRATSGPDDDAEFARIAALADQRQG